MAKKEGQKKRTGTLYWRYKGKDFGIDDPAGINGVIWLQYRLHGKLYRQSLKTSDIKEAEADRDKIMNPLQVADEAEATAQLALRASQAQQKHDEIALNQTPPLSIEDAWDEYLISPERPDSGAATLRNYGFQWKRFTDWLEKNYAELALLNEVTSHIASAYAADLTKAKFAPSTYNKHINLVKLVFETLQEKAQIDENPFGKIKRKKLKTETKRDLTKQELQDVLESAPDDLKMLFFIGGYTGLRLGDCATLRWGEVDMTDRVIKRIPSKTKHRKPKPIFVGIPDVLHSLLEEIPIKNRRGYLMPDIASEYQKDSPGLSDRIQKHFVNCGIQIHKPGTGYEKAPDPTGKHEYIWKYTGKRAVVEVGFHSLRHTFVSMHATLGTAQAVIQAIVGHGNPAMTAHYTHIGKAAAIAAAGALGSGVQDAEYQVIEDEEVVPEWVLDDLDTMTSRNWQKVRGAIVKKARPDS